ncbi:hypothetical protein KQX54_001671 [Cotesia glomerata]|uniref:Uncharacterized protein n=1 Tax=Cotesia glomerata TaxID=32391 RepID=A0AAV7HV58_COTGL|nr:hypothetical protein KQX54_001671 [Cotesia glomerata]
MAEPRPFRLETSLADEKIEPHHLSLAKEMFEALPYFNGEGANAIRDFEVFEGIVRNWLTVIPLDHQQHFAHRLTQRIHGRARRMIEHTDLTTVEDILRKLATKLKKGDPYLLWQKKLASASQEGRRKHRRFYYRLRDILQGISDTAPEADKEVVRRDFRTISRSLLIRASPGLPEMSVLRRTIFGLESYHQDQIIFGKSGPGQHRSQPSRGPRYDDQGNYLNQGRVLAFTKKQI